MYMKRILWLLASVMLCLAACNDSPKESDFPAGVPVIKISADKGDVLHLSDFADSIEIIPLETRDDNLIGWIPRILSTDSHYYIVAASGWHSKKLLVFDKRGNFIRQISKEGEGPEEYVDLRDIALVGDTLIKLSAVYNMLNFDTCGTFRSSRKQRDTPKEICHFKGKTLSYSSGSRSRENQLLTLIDNQDILIRDFFPVSDTEAKVSDAFSREAAFTPGDSLCYFNPPLSNRIYGIDVENDCKTSLRYQIDYGNRNLSWDVFGEDGDASTWGDVLKRGKNYLAVSAILDLGNHLIVNSTDKEYNGYFSIYSKRSGRVMTGQCIKDDVFFRGNLLRLKAMDTPHYRDGNRLVWVIKPEFLLNGCESYRKLLGEHKWHIFCKRYPHLVKVCDRLKEDSNPVLMSIKLKDF